MKTVRTLVEILLVVLLFTTSSACAQSGPVLLDGQVEALQAGSTAWGIGQAYAEKAGTFRLLKDGLVMFGWPLKNGVGFAIVDANTKLAVKDFVNGGMGNFANSKTVQDLIAFLKDNGWKEATAKELPPSIAQGLATATGWLSSLASKTMPTFIFVPLAPLQNDLDMFTPQKQ